MVLRKISMLFTIATNGLGDAMLRLAVDLQFSPVWGNQQINRNIEFGLHFLIE